MTDKRRGKKPGPRDPYFSDQSPYLSDHSKHDRNPDYRDNPERDPRHRDERARDTREQHTDRYTRSDPQYQQASYHPDEHRNRHDQHNRAEPQDTYARQHDRYDAQNSFSDRDEYRTNSKHPDEHRPSSGTRTHYPFEFHGKTGEYFKIWIVNIFLTIITLYIYSAWAKVRTKRYFYGNTTVDNSSFEYHATGKQLVVGRLIAAALLIIYTVFQDINVTVSLIALGALAILFPWALWRSLKFNAKASSFRNIRFGFEGNASTPYGIFIAIPALIAITLAGAYFINKTVGSLDLQESLQQVGGFMLQFASHIITAVLLLTFAIVPLLHKSLISYSHNNHRYGVAGFSANIKASRMYGIYFVALLLLIAAFFTISGLVFVVAQSIDFNDDFITQLQTNDSFFWKAATAAFGYAFIIATTGVAVAYFRSAIRNHRFNATSAGNRVHLRSKVKLWPLWWLNTSNLALIILSLGLAYPYTKIRTARFFAAHTALDVEGGLDSFTAAEKTRLQAMGEEMADAFDVEFDIGI